MKKPKKRKISLSVELIVTMIFLVMGTVGVLWFLNAFLLEKYYVYNKQKEMLAGYNLIDAASESEIIDSHIFDVPFEKICTNGNINILIVDENRRLVRTSAYNQQAFEVELYEIIRNTSEENIKTIEHADNYILAKLSDERMGADYLILAGNLSDGSYIYMRSSIEGIRESVKLSNKFMALIGLGALLISLIVIIVVSKSISRPVKKLSRISERMTELDFDAKYESQNFRVLEIEELGENMNNLSEKLEKTISELKCANNELKQDIRRKEEIDEMRKEFLSNVSHELKTPMALIQGYAEGLKEFIDEDPDSRNYYCEVIMDESDKMNKMVQKLLTLNQLEFGNDVIEMTRFNIVELISGVISASNLLAVQKEVTINFDASEPYYVWGDEFKVEEVVTNYLSNALNHIAGENVIDIKCKKREGLLRTSVFNTGAPIPEEDIEKIWIKFYKVDKARTREYGGSGIGLSIVKAIMDSMNQRCGVINHENGVEFWFELECNQ